MTRDDATTDPQALLQVLRARHADLEQRLTDLERHRSLTPAEQLERAELKKLKLATKDRIQQIEASLSL